jgi:hypothetical protein
VRRLAGRQGNNLRVGLAIAFHRLPDLVVTTSTLIIRICFTRSFG